MAFQKVTKQSGRTPEQQAARDARKAARLAAAAAAAAEPADETEQMAESSSMAAAKPEESEQSRLKRRREEEENDDTLLEIDVAAPEPLSKAEARAAKKRAKKGLPEAPKKAKNEDKDDHFEAGDEDEEVDQTRKKGENRAVRKQNSIWIGNLSFKTTEESLKQFLEKGVSELGGVGEGSVTRVNLPKKAGKGGYAENKGFAYADFATPELQALGVQLSEAFFEGRKLLIKLGNDHKETPNARTPKPAKEAGAAILKKQPNKPSATLFVGNLSFDTTEEGLRDFIESNASGSGEKIDTEESAIKNEEADVDPDAEDKDEVEDLDKHRGGKKSGLRKVRLGAFEDSGRCKGFAFLDFHTVDQATAVLINRKNYTLVGRSLLLQYASEDAARRAGSGPKGHTKRAPRTERAIAQGDRPPPHARPPRPVSTPKSSFIDIQPRPRPVVVEAESRPMTEGPDTYVDRPERSERKNDKRGKKWEATGRPKPGAALAMAKREKVGIVEAKGEKITFD
ncbi:hypothetical protein BD324DRAFT_678396 [Kockovaella imperatae]|uniref:RRM domain-containing protein n=1 Tax=Kockovaella imperatae TaxID=4999 RepID=A0A1Y1UTY2_9TREE|nr:hypothetical protein BD324DRAFT_678396 [Kockovaella imperatae]ORX40994.1 hypothetical protein BD324DRAFT_678396 [Kockovaella imperatae]